jgi:hypothetical protein
MRQFKIERGERRLKVALPVNLKATDVDDYPIDQQVMTVDVSRTGALLTGIHGRLREGAEVALARQDKQEQFLVAWVGKPDTPESGNIGVSALDPDSTFWSDVIDERSSEDSVEAESAKPSTKLKAKAQTA